MSEWQPIETAPKDGLEFLACEPIAEYLAIVRYNGAGEFELVSFNGSGFGIGFYPTYWQHLPEPPK